MPTLNIKLQALGANVPEAARPRIAVGEARYHQDTIDLATHKLRIDGDSVAMEYLPVGFMRVWPLAEGYRYTGPTGTDYRDVELVDGDNPQVTLELDRIWHGGQRGFLTAPIGKLDLYDDTGTPCLFAGIATHLLLNEVVARRDIRPLLEEWLEVGATSTIAIGQHLSPFKIANGYKLDPKTLPGYQDYLAEMFDVHAEMGMRCMFHIWADHQYQDPTWDDIAHFHRCSETMRGRWNAFASKGNEYKHNGWKPERYNFPDMAGVLTTQGSGGETENPFVPYLNICLFEVTRGPKRLYDNGAGMRQIFDGDFEGPATQRVTLSIEPTAYNDVTPDHVGDTRETDKKVALAMAVNIAANCGGGGLTMSKPMECKRMTEGDKAIAREWFRGLRAGYVR